MPGGMYMSDKDDKVVLLNEQIRELFDFPEGLIVVGGPVEASVRYQAERGDFGEGDVDELIEQAMTRFASGEPTRYERRLSTGRVVEISVMPTPDGGHVAVYTDITERKEAEEVLARKEAQLRIALDNMPGGMSMSDKNNNVVVFNEQLLELFDIPEGLLVIGGPVEASVRYQAARGDFGEGDVDDLVEQIMVEFTSDEPTQYERRLFTGRVVEMSVVPTPDGGHVAVYTDITERKEAEEELARKEAQLRVAMDNMPGGMFMVDENLVVQVINQQYKEMYVLPDEAARAGGPLRDVVKFRAERGDYGPGDPEELVEQRMRGYIDRMTLRHEEQLSNGRVVELMRTPVDGGGVVGIATDITERKAAEQKLTQTLGEFSAVLETIDYGIAFVDADLKARVFNRAVREMWGFSEEVLAKMPAMADLMYLHRYSGIYDVADDEFDDYVATRVEAVRSGSIAPTEMTRADGKVFQYQCTALPDGGRMLTYFDITERKRAEETLRASERRYATITSNIPGVVYERVQHPDGRIEFPYVSDGLYETHGVKPEDAMRDANAWLDRTHPDDREALAKSNAESLANIENWDHEDRIISGDGRTLWMHGSSHVHREENGDIVWHGILLDVTDRKRAEAALAEKETQLRLAMDNMPGALVCTDEDLNIVLCSERFSEIMQAPRYLLQPGRPYTDFLRYLAEHGYYGEGDVEALIAERVKSLRNPSGKTFEDLTPDGRVYHIRRQRVAAGGTVTVATDITDRKRAERELAEKEAQLRVAMDNMPGGMRLIDSDLKNLLFNSRYSALCNYPDDLLEVGGSMSDELHYQAERGDFGPGDADALIEQVLGRYRRVEATSIERNIPGGPTLQIDVAPTPEGGYVSILTDITERKQAEEALRESEERYEAITSNVPGVVYERVMQPDGSISYPYVSPGLIDIYGLEPEAVMVDPSLLLDTLHPDDRDGFFESLRASAEAVADWVHEFRIVASDGMVKWIRGGSRIHKEENDALVWHGILLDISEEKRAQEAVREKSAIVELLHKTAADANQAQDVDQAMRSCLDAICAYTGWPVGHVYVRSGETPDVLVPTDI